MELIGHRLNDCRPKMEVGMAENPFMHTCVMCKILNEGPEHVSDHLGVSRNVYLYHENKCYNQS